MLDKFLPEIKDTEDYLAVLSLFRMNGPLGKEEAEKLLDIYARYLEAGDDPAYIKVCLAVDMLPGRTMDNAADFEALDLGDGDLRALFAARGLIYKKMEAEARDVLDAVEQIHSDTLSMPVKVLLARTALDAVAASRNFAAMREQAAALAEFLTGCGTEILDRYTGLAGEVRMKCWQ